MASRSSTLPSHRTLVVATAGHIDHGKTALVRALTGIDTDRLPEEKRRGITIDLGFASMEVQQPDAGLRISFVDVPGHALFVRNMVAGTGCVPAVLFIVAANEGIMPQTVEHLAICELLGVKEGIIALTKSDCVNQEQLDLVAENVRALVGDTFLYGAPVVPVSARTGKGLDILRQELVHLAARIHAPATGALLRLPIDRAFVMKGFGTVVTGTLLSNSIRQGDLLTIEPGGRSVRVRGLQAHGHPEHNVEAGTRVAVNLSGIDLSAVHRGQALVAPNTLTAVKLVDVEIRLLADAPPLRHGSRVHFHAFTSEVMARVSLYERESLQPGTTRLARIKLEHAVVLAPGDRFVLRQPAPVATIGGGRVLDCRTMPRERKATTLSRLELMRKASVQEQLVLRIQRRGKAGIRVAELAGEAGLTVEKTRVHLEPALESGDVSLVGGDLLLGRSAYAQLQRETEAAQRSSQPTSPESQRVAEIAQAYESAGLAAPLVSEVAQRFRMSERDTRHLITLLQRQKTIIRMGSDDLFIHASALDRLTERLTSMRGKSMDVGGFKQLTGLSRKYAIPLLEYLDHIRVTRKEGDRRLVL